MPDDSALGIKSAPTPTPGPSFEPKPVTVTDGFFMSETEELYYDENALELVNFDGASGGKVLQVKNEDKNVPATDAYPSLDLSFIPDKSGVYNIWLRLTTKGDSGGNSVFLSKDGGGYLYVGFSDESLVNLGWVKLTQISAKAGKTALVRIIRRQKNDMRFDKVIITNNILYTPEKEGSKPSGEIDINDTFPKDQYPMPSITPPPSHPRVLVTADNLPTIKENMNHPENAKAVEKFRSMAANGFDGVLPDKDTYNYDGELLSSIEAKAFDYLINENTENGKAAIEAIKNYADTCTYDGLSDNTRAMGHVMFTASEVYDWCYPILTAKDRSEIMTKILNISAQMEIGLPPSGQSAVTSHGGEAQLLRDWLSFGIATYNEYPNIYNFVAGRFFSEFVAARNYWFASETHHQGSAYGMYRYNWSLWGELLINKMSGQNAYIPEAGKVPYQWIYTRRPDGQHLREGDDYNENNNNVNLWRTSMNVILILSANMFKDPILKKHLLRDNNELQNFSYQNTTASPVQVLLINDPSIDISSKADITELPLTKYFASPLGQMIARTGWNFGINSPDTIAYMRIGEVFAANHNHRDSGNFQIYYKGILASESGFYDSYNTAQSKNYNQSSIAHNTFIITSEANPTGVQIPAAETKTLSSWMESDTYKRGEVIGHEFGPDTFYPEYSYIAGDIAKAYDENVQQALRSMIFMPTNNSEYPAVFVVFDKITTKETTSKKTFALHMQSEPKINGNVSVIKNTDYGYNGMLTNQTLLPKKASIEKIGGEGKQFMVGDTNYPLSKDGSALALEEGWGRIEISAPKGNSTDYFLNVMYVSDADKNLPVQKAELIEGDGVTGARVLDKVAVFNNNKTRTKENISFTIPGEGEVNISVAGLEAGTWQIKENDADIGTQVSSADGGIIYFSARAGKIELSYKSSDANKTFTTSEPPYNEGIGIKLNGNYIYSDVAPTIVDDRTLLPMRAIFEALGADISWDAETATATAKTDDVTIKITENQTTAYVNDIPNELDVPAMIINGRFVVPVRFVSESLGAAVSWDELSSLVKITAAVKTSDRKKWDIANAIDIQSAVQNRDDGDGNVIENSFDGFLATRWAAEGANGEAWGVYDLGKVYVLDSILLSYFNGSSRIYSFDILVSEDRENYTEIITGGKSSGTTDQLEEYDMNGAKARYIKYIGRGNTVNIWNSLTEIVPIEKK